MKFKFISNSFVLLAIALCFAACKKTNKTPVPTAPTDPAIAAQTVATQAALNISQSLFGGLSSFNLSGGLNAPVTFAVKTGGKVLQTVTPSCSLLVDTTLTYSYSASGTTVNISGTKNASFTCTNNLLSGYTMTNALTIAIVSADSTVSYKVAENYTVVSLDATNSSSNLSVNGSLSSNETYQITTGTTGTGTSDFSYMLTSVVYTPVATGVTAVSGSATFTTTGTGPKGVWTYQGTITFLGNNMATVTIGTTSYTINLLTGAVS